MGKHIKELKIYYDDNTVLTLVVSGEKKPQVKEQDDHWEDEREQVLDDYD